jgi:hypothetical protein
MRTLATVHLYGHFRTYYGADGTAGTFAAVIKGDRYIATGRQFIRQSDRPLGTKSYTDLASLAQLLVDFNITICLGFCYAHNPVLYPPKLTDDSCFDLYVLKLTK